MPSRKAQQASRSARRQPPTRLAGGGSALDLTKLISVTVVLHSRNPQAKRDAVASLALELPRYRKALGVKAFEKRYGARHEDVRLVKSFAKRHGLKVLESSTIRRCVLLSATKVSFSRAFGVKFVNRRTELGVKYRAYTGKIRLPKKMANVVAALLGLETRPFSSPSFFLPARYSIQPTHPKGVAEFYDFPAGVDGKGQCVAIVELDGGFHEEDMKEYFDRTGNTRPLIRVVGIDGHKNNPASPETIGKILDAAGLGSPGSKSASTNPFSLALELDPEELMRAMWTIETTMDIQLAATLASGAEIVVYFAPNTSHGKFHALTAALATREHWPSVISCSWGALETNLPRDFMQVMDSVFQDAALRGMMVCASSGDTGDGAGRNGQPSVQFPAASPHVLGCGGTHWIPQDDAIREVVWNEPFAGRIAKSGGGVSAFFPRPDWQYSAAVELKTGRSGRGVPDVSARADIRNGFSMVVGGRSVTMGGTSASAPVWASLFARINQKLGKRVGYVTPLLYQDLFRDAIHDVTIGSNGAFIALPGWDACTGLGTPNGTKLLAILSGKVGIPKS